MASLSASVTSSMASDVALLRSFPGSTSASSAAFAISRAVSRSVQAPLAPDALEAARHALAALSTSPAPLAVAGLVDAVEHGAQAPGVDSFVLAAGAWRALLVLADVVRDAEIAARILGASALSALSVLAPTVSAEVGAAPAAKRMRIARFHAANGARFARAFRSSIPNPSRSNRAWRAALMAADLFGAVALRAARYPSAGAQSLGEPVAILLAGCFRLLPQDQWSSALNTDRSHGDVYEESVHRRIIVALYMVRLARSNVPVKGFAESCSLALQPILLPFLFRQMETHGNVLLCIRTVPDKSCLAVIMASAISTLSVHLDDTLKDSNRVVTFLLSLVSIPSWLVSSTASRALVDIVSARDLKAAKRILIFVQDAYNLAAAVHSPFAHNRWRPLLTAIESKLRERGFIKNVIDFSLLSEAGTVIDLEKANDSARSKAWLEKASSMIKIDMSKDLHWLIAAIARVCAQSSEASNPPRQAIEMTKCILNSMKHIPVLQKKSAMYHVENLIRNLPIGMQRSELESKLAGIREEKSLSAHIHHHNEAESMVRGLQHSIARISRAVCGTDGAQIDDSHKPVNAFLAKQLTSEISSILHVAQALQIVLQP